MEAQSNITTLQPTDKQNTAICSLCLGKVTHVIQSRTLPYEKSVVTHVHHAVH